MTITSATIGSLHVSYYTRKARATQRVLEKEEFIVQIKMMLLYFNSTHNLTGGILHRGHFGGVQSHRGYFGGVQVSQIDLKPFCKTHFGEQHEIITM